MNVFISYAISPESQEAVKQLTQTLRARNITVYVDMDAPAALGPPEGWIQWMRNTIRIADWVLILFDENYLRAWYGQETRKELYGSTYEARLISHNLYVAHGRNTKFIPLHYDRAEPDLIPEDFQCDRYGIPSHSDELVDKLLSTSPIRALQFKTDFTRLPRIVTRDLINREQTINALYHALEAPQVSVIGLVADGGVGKTAVMFDWLSKLDTVGYGLTHIFAWPFLESTTRPVTTSDQFFADAFKHFGRVPEQRSLNLPHAQAESLLHILRSSKSLIVLDGLESLQDGSDTANRGRINDQELLWLLKTAALTRMGQEGRLIVVTSRVTLADLSNDPGYMEERLPPLKSEHGAELISRVGVRGTQRQLAIASDKYQGHCLSLVLLGKIIANYYPDCDVNNCTLIDPLVGSIYDIAALKGPVEHARRVMHFYEGISNENDILLLEMMGLFLEPMDATQKQHLVDNAKFAEPLRFLQPKDWVALENNLEEYGLLLPESGDTRRRTKWACHKLIREYFRGKLRENNDFWRDANSVLFDFFENIPSENLPSSREGLRPLYRAVRHGCLAHRFADALEVYKTRILREPALGYSTNRLGAAAEDIGCLQGFLSDDSQVKNAVVKSLPASDIAWLWARMAFCETCKGSLEEAIHYRRKQLEFCKSTSDVMGQASALENLSSLWVLSGDLAKAEDDAREALSCALSAKDWGQQVLARCRVGVACFFRGNTDDAKSEFSKAFELNQQKGGPVPWLHMDHGFYYRLWRLDWACNDGQYEEILRDAQGAASGPDRSWVAAEALDTLVKAIVRSRQGRERDAAALFAEAFELLKEAGYVVHLPYYYNALAEFHLRKNNFDEALHNVSEAGRIARYYGIPLAEVDSYLVEAEVLIARGSVDEARDIQEKASELIGNHGYNLKTLETTLLQAQIALLDGRTSEGQGILDGALKRIKDTGRASLSNRRYLVSH